MTATQMICGLQKQSISMRMIILFSCDTSTAMPKHVPIAGTDLRTIRDLLFKHEKNNNRLLLATAIDYLHAPPKEADSFLRKLALAGYIEWLSNQPHQKDWELTDRGLRLINDDLTPRMSREVVDEIIATVLKRARTINSDPTRLARIAEIRLFGSVLDETRKDYGDVDIEVRIEIRTSPADEIAELRTRIANKVPQSWRRNFLMNLNAEDNYDRRNVKTILARGIKGLSLTQDTINELGCEYRTIYRFDTGSSSELAPDSVTTPRATPTSISNDATRTSSIPSLTVIRPLGLAQPSESILSDDIRLSVSSLAYDEAIAWLGQPGLSTPAPLDVKSQPNRRFAEARYLFQEWRDLSLSGLELFQRTLDWATLFEIPIAKADRSFTLRTYRNTRVANFHALLVKREADRIEAELVLRDYGDVHASWHRLGGSQYTTPRMVAAHHALAVAFGRMLDETRLTGQVDFRAEFDLTGERRNSYPQMPNLSGLSRDLRRLLPRVRLPDDVLKSARKRKHKYRAELPINREVEISGHAAEIDRGPFFTISTHIGADWIKPATPNVDEEGNEIEKFLPGEENLLDACERGSIFIENAMAHLPGCRQLSIRCKAPIVDRDES